MKLVSEMLQEKLLLQVSRGKVRSFFLSFFLVNHLGVFALECSKFFALTRMQSSVRRSGAAGLGSSWKKGCSINDSALALLLGFNWKIEPNRSKRLSLA